jgi:hypothetical protein
MNESSIKSTFEYFNITENDMGKAIGIFNEDPEVTAAMQNAMVDHNTLITQTEVPEELDGDTLVKILAWHADLLEEKVANSTPADMTDVIVV